MASGSRVTAEWLSELPMMRVVQPAHLETSDATLATEILPAPPPVATVSGTGLAKKDAKRPYGAPVVLSYLPASDPGSSFSSIYAQTFSEQPALPGAANGAGVAGETDAGSAPARRPKRARLLGR